MTLLIPCSSVPSMVRNGVCPSDSCEPRKHQISHFGGYATIIVGVALKKEKFRRNCAIYTEFCVATKKLIENEPTSKRQFLGWIFDFYGVSHSKNGVSAVEWGVPLRKSGVSEENSSEFRFEVALSAPSPKQ